jgi:hypothetical protein
MKKFIYPNCSKTFSKWIMNDPSYLYKFTKMGSPKAFDVTLNDGLKTLSLEEQYHFKMSDKKNLLETNIKKFNPFAISIGSLTSPKISPIMKDTTKFYNYAYNFYNKKDTIKPYFYINLYNQKQLDDVMGSNMFNNISLSTSLTDSFQYYSTRQTVVQKKKELSTIIYNLDLYCYNREIITVPYPQLKLYINCFSVCPIEGKLNNDYVIDEICNYYNYLKPDILCLKDNCALINKSDFEYIINKCVENGVNPSKIALHLRYISGYEQNTINIINSAIDNKITMFDVSSMTTSDYVKNTSYMCNINGPKNLTYSLFYKSIVDYIMNTNK